MPLLLRYLLRELIVPLVLWVLCLFLLLFVMQFLRGTEVLLGSAVSGGDLVRLVVYMGPKFLISALPVGLLLAILLGLGRLSEDRELVALQSVGVGPRQLLVAPLMVGAVLGVIMGLLAFRAVPWGLTEVKALVNDVIKRNVAGDVKSGVFYEDLSQLTVYAEKVDGQAGRWHHVLLHDDRDPRSPLLVLAQEGSVHTGREVAGLELQLADGEVHRDDSGGGDYAVVQFEQGQVAVGLDGALHRKNRFRSPKEELTPGELLQAAEEMEAAGKDGRPFRLHYHDRLSQVGMPLAFALLGTALAMGRRGSGRGQGFLLTVVAYVAYFVIARGCEQMGLRGRLPPWLAGQAANILFALVGAYLLWRMGQPAKGSGGVLSGLWQRLPWLRRAGAMGAEAPAMRRGWRPRLALPWKAGGSSVRGTLLRSLCRQYLFTFGGILLAVVAIFLVADFVDRARIYTGPNWVKDVAILYGHKALVTAHQLAPAALLLAAGVTISSLRRRGELTALKALGFPPAALLVPIAACAGLLCLGLVVFDEKVVVHSARRVEEITVLRFNRWGDWGSYFSPKQWFRKGEHVFHLRAGDADAGFQEVTVLTLGPDFRLARRLDAQRMEHVEGTHWRFVGLTERELGPEGVRRVVEHAEATYDLGVAASVFRIQMGRPEYMRLSQLERQIEARKAVGLAAQQFVLTLHNRFSYPMAGLPAALLAVLLAMRPGRRGHLTTALVEGLGVAVVLWGVMVVCRTLVLSERVPPAVAAWLPASLLLGATVALWLRREGRLGGGAG